VDVTKLIDKAQVASERGNYDYAIDLYLQLLDLQAGHVDARRMLRQVEVRKFQEAGVTRSTVGGWLKGIPSLLAALFYLAIRKYEKALSACETFLKNDPYNRLVQCLLARAAEHAEHLDAAILVLEGVRARDGTPKSSFAVRNHVKVLRSLGELYAQTQKLPKAAGCLEEILRLVPKDREAERRIRDVAAQRSMVEGGWDKAGQQGGYRQVLRSEEDAKKLEESHRDIRTREDIDAAVRRVKGDLAKEPTNTRYLTQLGDLYRMAKDWDQARAAYERAREIDPNNFLFQERLGDLKLAEMDQEIERLRRDGADKEKILQLRKERLTFAFQEYQKRVKARPQDLPTRYALGNILFSIKRYKDAAVQFQHASRDPKTRRPALYRLGICFQKQGLVDLAIEQFEKAVTGASIVDREVKEILYSLAEAHESQGRLAEALDAYKRVFEVDINFKDVSSKIEEIYKHGARDTG